MGFAFVKDCCLQEPQQNNTELDGKDTIDGNDAVRAPILEMTPTTFKTSVVKTLSRLPIRISTVIRKRDGMPSDYYEVMEQLGKGSYGKVFKVIHRSTRQVRAMKVISQDERMEGFTEEDIEREIKILKNLDHPNIIKIYEIFTDDKNFYIITEFCSDGDLCDKLIAMGNFTECFVKTFMCQIFSAVQYLHSRQIIHGDMKLDHIMIDSMSDTNMTFLEAIMADMEKMKESITEGKGVKFEKIKNFDLKLIDFGCSKIFTKYRKCFEDTIGTLYYSSPEVLMSNYSEKCDIWACGVIMYMLLSGEFPFPGRCDDEIFNRILAGKYTFRHPKFQAVSENAKDLIRLCLTYDPKKRITAARALTHPFFTEACDPRNIFETHCDSKLVLSDLKYSLKSSKFYQAVLAYLTHNFAAKEELSKLKRIFQSIDKNMDGKISKEELIQSYTENGMTLTNEEIDKMIKIIDTDNTGFIEYEEFIRATIQKETLFTEINLKTTFDLFDFDHCGYISCMELKEMLGIDQNVADNVVVDLLHEIDKKENDKISYQDFMSIMSTITKKIDPTI